MGATRIHRIHGSEEMRKTIIIETPDQNSFNLIPSKIVEALDNIFNSDIDEWWIKDESVSVKFTSIIDEPNSEMDPVVHAAILSAYYRGLAEGELKSIKNQEKR